MYMTQGLHRSMQANPDGIAVIFGNRQRTFAEFGARVAKLAGALQALGVQPNDRVAMLSLNSDRYLEHFMAVPWAGAALNPINIRWSAAEVVYSLNDSETTVLIVDDAFKDMVEKFRGDATTLKSVIYAGEGETPAGMVNYEDILIAAVPVADARRGGDDLAGVFYTGGTTGFPKGVMLSHSNIWSSSISLLAEGLFPQDSRYLHAAPMFHLADGAMTMAHFLRGGTHVIIPAYSPEAVMGSIQRHRITDTLLVPTMIQMLVDHPRLADHDLTSLKRIIYGASPISQAVLERAMERLPGARFTQAYGQTELSPLCSVLGSEYHTAEGLKSGKLRSAGRPGYCVEVKIVDADRNEVPHGTVGEIAVRGPNVMLGYWKKPEATAAALSHDGWLHTGDGAYMDAEGFIFIVDRMKDMIVTGGENVYSAEVENAVAQHPDVAQCAVIGIPDEQWGEAVHAVVVPKPGAELGEEDIRIHCHELIANYKCPRSVEITDALPLSGAGKVLKTVLRKPYWQGSERRVH